MACKACCRGWLARLEDAAQPALETMIAGNPLLLALQNQETVALWAVKTILMLQLVHDPELMPVAVFRELRDKQRPPTAFRIAVGLRPREGRWPLGFAAQASAATLRRWDVGPTFPGATIDHYRAELCVGHLVVRAGANFTPHARPIDRDPATVEIWPARVPMRWPPARGLVRIRPERVAA
jgi:hypothetical protein